MNCSEFEATLSDLLAGTAGEGEPRLARLREHAAGCAACAAATDLIDLAALPAEQRDPVEDPGPAYWREFDDRLASRLAVERRRSRRYMGLAVGLVAASVVVIVLVIGARRRVAQPRPVAAAEHPASPTAQPVGPEGPAEPAAEPFRSETPADSGTVDQPPAMEDDLVDVFADPEPLDAFAEDDPGGLFPDVDQMTPADATRFLEWLTREESRVRRGAA